MKQDTKTYSEMCVPFESLDAANEALRQFYEELAELRRKHRIMDVLCISQVAYADGVGFSMSSLGSSLASETLAAYGYGAARKRREQSVGELLAGKGTE